MVKTGVVDGISKTASADTEKEAIGSAAKCISAAMGALSGLSEAVRSIRKPSGPSKDDPDRKPENP